MSRLYDPSFGNGAFTYFATPPTNGPVIFKPMGGVPMDEGFWNYLMASVAYFRGFTFFKSSGLDFGLSIFDIPPGKVNYLKLYFGPFSSTEE